MLDKGLEILNSKNVNRYFEFKDKIIASLMKQEKKFMTISNNKGVVFSQINRKKEKNPIYKLDRYYSYSLEELRRKIVMFNRKPSGNLLSFETVERFSPNIQLGYFKYSILNKDFEFLAIIEDSIKENKQTTILKGIDNLMVGKSIEFFQIRAVKQGPSTTSLSITGFLDIEGV